MLNHGLLPIAAGAAQAEAGRSLPRHAGFHQGERIRLHGRDPHTVPLEEPGRFRHNQHPVCGDGPRYAAPIASIAPPSCSRRMNA